MSAVSRHLVWQSQEALDDLLVALANAKGRVTSAQSVRITELIGALQHGSAPAGLPRPEDENTADMSVTVRWPAGKGEMQTAVFDRNGGPDAETLVRHDRIIVRAMLEQALEDLR